MATIQIKEFDQIKQDFIDAIKSKVQENSTIDITDYNVGGVLNTIVEAFSDVVEMLYFDMFQITKESMENIYNGFNFYKIPGKKANCVVYIYLDTTDLIGAQNTVFFSIPKNTTITTDDGIKIFEIIDEYQSSNLQIAGAGAEFPGKVFYTANALCTVVGPDGNVLQNTLTKISSSITNVNSYSLTVRNTSASGGVEEESEEDMKARFQQYLVSLRRGSVEALGFALQTNANFTGFLYSISQYTPLFIVKQTETNVDQLDFSLNSNVYDVDLTDFNKFDLQYTLCDQNDASQNAYFALYFGSSDKFKSVLMASQAVTAGKFKIHKVQYYDQILGVWTNIDTNLLSITLDHVVVDDQYVFWDFADIERWGKINVLNYSGYFIRFIMQQLADPLTETASIQVFKTMTYPFPGYVDLYCLKNYRDNININDKIIIQESVENYKAAGVVTTVQNADVIQMYPVVIIYTSNLALSFVPSTIVSDIKNDIIAFANTLNISQDFDKNAFYSYIYNKYNQYGNIFIFYRYDNVLNENPQVSIYKEQFRNIVFEASVAEKVDLGVSDVFVVTNLNTLVMTTSDITLTDYDIYDLYYFDIAY